MVVEAAGDAERAQALRQSAQNVRDSSQSALVARDEARELAQSAKDKLSGAQGDLDASLKPTLESLSTIVSDAGESLSSTAAVLDTVGSDLTNASDSLAVRLGSAKSDLDNAAASLEESAGKLSRLSTALNEALASDNLEMLRQVVGSDPSALAAALTTPVALERHAVYPVENFGSAMSPLYTTLALWIGSLLMMVTLQVVPSRRALEELDRPTSRQEFLGRFGVVSLISLAQSTCVSVGNMVFLGVQVAHPFLYLLCFWIAGLCFAFMIYTLVVLFANLGKAIGVVLLIVQVSGGGGSFPLKLLPEFFQNVSPYLPITHAVNAMRAAMFGVYQGDFWIQIGVLVLFTAPFLVLGLVLNGPLGKVVPKFVAKVESTKVM